MVIAAFLVGHKEIFVFGSRVICASAVFVAESHLEENFTIVFEIAPLLVIPTLARGLLL